jgi:hypothetical protein
MARAALFVALLLCLAGAMPAPKFNALWMIALGMFVGLASSPRDVAIVTRTTSDDESGGEHVT